MGDISNSVHCIIFHIICCGHSGVFDLSSCLCVMLSGDVFDWLSVAEFVSEIFFKLLNIWESYKQERDCLVHFVPF